MSKKLCFSSIILFLSTILFIGCSNKQMMNQESGFLLKYDDLQDSKSVQGAKFYIAKNVDFSKYENIYIKPVQVLHNIPKDELTKEQTILFSQIENYLTLRYKSIIQGKSNYKIVNKKTEKNTLIFEASISAVEVHTDDFGAMDFMPMMLVAKAISTPFREGSVRLLGEARISDSNTHKVLVKTMRLHKGNKVKVSVDKLTFKDIKPALDVWLNGTKNNLSKLKRITLKRENKNEN